MYSVSVWARPHSLYSIVTRWEATMPSATYCIEAMQMGSPHLEQYVVSASRQSAIVAGKWSCARRLRGTVAWTTRPASSSSDGGLILPAQSSNEGTGAAAVTRTARTPATQQQQQRRRGRAGCGVQVACLG